MPRIFSSGGWWALGIPIAILVLLLVGVLRTPSETEESSPPPPGVVFTPSFSGLRPVPSGHYELWMQKPEGGEERLAVFAVGAGGALFTLSGDALQSLPIPELPPPQATLLLTVEAGSEPAATRSPRVLLNGTLAETEVSFATVLPETPSGNVALLLAPSGARTPDTAGIWLARATSGGSRNQGLKLPAAPAGWTYGAFVTTSTGVVLRTGAFADPTKPDRESLFSGTGKQLALPGEDFVRNAPEGVRFPPNLADGRSTLTVALLPDFASSAEEPFLVFLSARIPYQQKTGTPFPLTATSLEEFPRGSGKFEQQGTPALE